MYQDKVKTFLFVVLSLGMFLSASNSHGQLMQNLTIGNAKAIALGHAVTADPPGIDSIHFNPAGLSRLKGRQVQLNFLAADASLTGKFTSNDRYDALLEEFNETDPIANTTSEIDAVAFYSPIGGITEIPVPIGMVGGMSFSPPNSKMVFATSVYAPLIGGYIRDENDPGRYYGKEVGLSRITFFSPTVSYQVTSTLALGAGLGFSYFGAAATIDFRAPNAAIGIVKNIADATCDGEGNGLVFQGVPIDLCGGELSPFETLLSVEVDLEKKVSTTFNLGFLWEVTPWLTFGGVYQSEAVDTLEGDVLIELHDNLLGFTQGLADSNPVLNTLVNSLQLSNGDARIERKGTLDFTLPAHAALGISLQITPSLKLNVDWKWTESEVWDELKVEIDEPHPVLALAGALGVDNISATSITLPRNYENTSNFAYGIEYQLTDRTALRVGYEPRKTGIPKNTMDFLVPLGDFDFYGVGSSHKLDRDSVLDISIAYFKSEIDIPAGSSENGNNGRIDNIIYNPSTGLDVSATVEAVVLEIGYRTQF